MTSTFTYENEEFYLATINGVDTGLCAIVADLVVEDGDWSVDRVGFLEFGRHGLSVHHWLHWSDKLRDVIVQRLIGKYEDELSSFVASRVREVA